MFVYAMRKNLYGLVSIVSDDNLCHFASYSWWVLEMIFRNIVTQWLIQQFVLVELGGVSVEELRSMGGTLKSLSVRSSGGKRPRKFWLFCIPNSSKHCSCSPATTNGDNLSIFRWTNFYTFESLGFWVWDSKRVYQLQNSSAYSTATKLEFCKTLNISFLCSLANLA